MQDDTHAAQDKRRAVLIERIGTIADMACDKPLEGELGDIAYDLLRQAAAQISSDRQHITAEAQAAARVEVLEWVSEASALPRIGQSILLATPRQVGEFWDIETAWLAVRHEGAAPTPIQPGSRWPTDFFWKVGRAGKEGSVLVTGNAWWASLGTIPLPPRAEHHVINGYHCIKQDGPVFVPQHARAALSGGEVGR